MTDSRTLQTLEAIVVAYKEYVAGEFGSSVTDECQESLDCGENDCSTIPLQEWTVSTHNEHSHIGEIWFSFEARLCQKFLEALDLSEDDLSADTYIEAAKEFMNFIVGHATQSVPQLLQSKLAAISPCEGRPDFQNLLLQKAEIHTDTGNITILLTQKKS